MHHLQEEEVPSQFLEQTPHDELVNASTEEESYERSCVLVDFHRGNGRMVDVAEEEVVHRPIPISCKLIPGHTIPPVGIEPPISEIGEFGEEIEDALPNHIPGLEVC